MPEETKVVPPELSPVQSFKQEVASEIAAANPTIRGNVKTKLVEDELKKRAEMILSGLNKLDEANRELRKFKPDQVAYDDKGGKTETYSKQKFEERRKATEKAASIEKAVTEALVDHKYDKLAKIAKGEPAEEETKAE